MPWRPRELAGLVHVESVKLADQIRRICINRTTHSDQQQRLQYAARHMYMAKATVACNIRFMQQLGYGHIDTAGRRIPPTHA
jgi:hypothetical protein